MRKRSFYLSFCFCFYFILFVFVSQYHPDLSFDQDNDVSHPNYDPAITASLPPALKLGSLPARGELFQALDGAPVDRIGSELLAAPDG